MPQFLTYGGYLVQFGYQDNDASKTRYEDWLDTYYALLAMQPV